MSLENDIWVVSATHFLFKIVRLRQTLSLCFISFALKAQCSAAKKKQKHSLPPTSKSHPLPLRANKLTHRQPQHQ